MIKLLTLLLTLVGSGIISARLYKRNLLHYTYFVAAVLFFYPYFSNFMPLLPIYTNLIYFPVIMSPFLIDKKLFDSLKLLIPFVFFIFLMTLLVGSNLILFGMGMVRYIYFFLVLLLFFKTPITKDQYQKIAWMFIAIGAVQLPVNIINFFYLKQFFPRIHIQDIGSGTFGKGCTCSLSIYLIVTLILLIFTKIGQIKKIAIATILIAALSLSYSGGGVLLFFIVFPFIMLGSKISLKNRLSIFAVIIIGTVVFKMSHASVLHFLPSHLAKQMYGNLMSYTTKIFYKEKKDIKLEKNTETPKRTRASNTSAAISYASREGHIIIGGGCGTLNRSSALSKIIDIKKKTNLKRVFKNNEGLLHTFAIVIGELGILGILIFILYFFYFFIHNHLANYNAIIFNIIFIMIFVFFSYYDTSIHSQHFLFIWSFSYFNIHTMIGLKDKTRDQTD